MAQRNRRIESSLNSLKFIGKPLLYKSWMEVFVKKSLLFTQMWVKLLWQSIFIDEDKSATRRIKERNLRNTKNH